MAPPTMCTSFHFLTFRPDVTFHDPKTPDGKLWYSALKFITKCQGWQEMMWGARCDQPGANLFLYWETEFDLTKFLKSGHSEFVSILKACFPPVQPINPFCCNGWPLQVRVGMEGVSTVYLVHFDNGLSEGANISMQVEPSLLDGALGFYAEEIGDQPIFRSLEGQWIARCSSSPTLSNVKESLAAAEHLSLGEKTMLVVETCEGREVEQRVHEAYRRAAEADGFREIIFSERFSASQTEFEQYQTSFEIVVKESKATLDVLDSEERPREMWARLTAQAAAESAERAKSLHAHILAS